MTKSAFNPPKQSLDIITEDQEQKDDEDEDEIDKNSAEKTDHVVSGIRVGEKVKSGVKSYVGKGSSTAQNIKPVKTSHSQQKPSTGIIAQSSSSIDQQSSQAYNNNNVTRKNGLASIIGGRRGESNA